MDLSKLKAEEDAAVEALYGKQSIENPSEEAPIPEEGNESVPVPETIATEHIPEPEATTETTPTKKPKKERVSWKNRYANYKAATDATIHELRLENASQRETILTLQNEVAKVQNDMANLSASTKKEESLFTQEDEDILGPEAIAIMEKAMKAKETEDPRVKSLEQELEILKRERLEAAKREKEKLASDGMQVLKSKLTELFPKWSELDTTSEFADYIKGIDPISGHPRELLFQRAMQSRDIERILSFYKNFDKLTNPTQKEDVLAGMITPTGRKVSESNPDSNPKKTYKMSDYRKFMDDYTKGLYRGREKEARKIELTFDKALMEGRMVE